MGMNYKIVNKEVLEQLHKGGTSGEMIEGLFSVTDLAKKVGFVKFDCKVVDSGTKNVTSAIFGTKDPEQEMVIIARLVI